MNLDGSIRKLEDISSPCQAREFFNKKKWMVPDYQFYKMFHKRLVVLLELATTDHDEFLYADLIEDLEIEREKLNRLERRKQLKSVPNRKPKSDKKFSVKTDRKNKNIFVTVTIESFQEHCNLLQTLSKELTLIAIDAMKGNRVKAAKILGITERTLRYKLKRFEEEK